MAQLNSSQIGEPHLYLTRPGSLMLKAPRMLFFQVLSRSGIAANEYESRLDSIETYFS